GIAPPHQYLPQVHHCVFACHRTFPLARWSPPTAPAACSAPGVRASKFFCCPFSAASTTLRRNVTPAKLIALAQNNQNIVRTPATHPRDSSRPIRGGQACRVCH